MPDDTQNNLNSTNNNLTGPTPVPLTPPPNPTNPQMIVEPINPAPPVAPTTYSTPATTLGGNPTPPLSPVSTVEAPVIKQPEITDYNINPPTAPPTNTATDDFQTNDVGFVATTNEPVISTPQVSNGSSTPKKSFKTTIIIGIVILLSIAIPATVYLTQRNSENRSKAETCGFENDGCGNAPDPLPCCDGFHCNNSTNLCIPNTPLDNTCAGNGGQCVADNYICTPPNTSNYTCPSGQKCVSEAAICNPPPTSSPTDNTCLGNSGQCVADNYICTPPNTSNYTCPSGQKCVSEAAICHAPIQCTPYDTCSTAGNTCTLVCTRGYINWTCRDKGGTLLWQPTNPNANECPGQCPWVVPVGTECCPDGIDGCDNIGAKQCFSDPWISECTSWPSTNCVHAGYWKWLQNVEICAIATPPPSFPPGATPSPTLGGQCTDLKIYKVSDPVTDAASWVQVTTAQLPTLKAGETIYVTVLGTTVNDTVDKARIRVNSSTWSTENETTVKKPGSEEYYIIYTIPPKASPDSCASNTTSATCSTSGTSTCAWYTCVNKCYLRGTDTTSVCQSFTFGAEVHAVTQNKWF